MSRRPYRILEPKRGKRRYFTAIFAVDSKRKIQRSTGTTLQAAAKEWATIWIRENSPVLCRQLDIQPHRKPRL